MFCGARGPWQRLILSFHFHSHGLLLYPQWKREIKIQLTNAAVLCSGENLPTPFPAPEGWGRGDCDDGGRGSRAGTTIGCSPSDMASSGNNATSPESPQSLASAHPLAAMDLPSLLSALGPACVWASWRLSGLQWLSPSCNYRWLLSAWPSQTRSLIGLLLFTQDLSSRLCCFSATFLSRHF